MALATQCPHCHTSFRVANDQLKLHAGLVRCGQCQQTFNGIEHLLAPDGSPLQAAIPASVTTQSQSHEVSPSTIPIAVADVSEPIAAMAKPILDTPSKESLDFDLGEDESESESDHAWDEHAKEAKELELQTHSALMQEDQSEWSKNEPSFPDESNPSSDASEAIAFEVELPDEDKEESAIEQANRLRDDAFFHHEEVVEEPSLEVSKSEAGETQETERVVSNDHMETKTEADLDEDEDEDEGEKPNFVLQAEKKQRRAKWQRICFALLILVLLLAALVQGVYFFRVMIAAHFPSSKVHLLKICEKLKCEIKFPAQKEALEISGKELQNESPELHLQVLSVQIQNNSSTIQAWPMLELVLQDSRHKPVLQRVFAPSEYLEDKTLAAKGIPATSEQNIKVYFENASVKAANFTVDLFYP